MMAEHDSSDLQAIGRDLQSIFDNGGMDAVKRKITELKDKWKNTKVNIGVIGRTGMGKSTFINAYRSIEYDDDPGAAPVGVTQTTMTATPYPDPKHKNIVLFDVPGVGTKDFPRGQYLTHEGVAIVNYDCIIIISSGRFTEDEVWLHREMKSIGKPAFLVRTKVENDASNEKKRKREYKNKTLGEMIKIVTDKYKLEEQREFGDTGETPKVYYIDSIHRDLKELEFDDLVDDIISQLPTIKQDAIIFSLQMYTPKVIQRKVGELRKRAHTVASMSALVAALPIPFVDIAVDIALIGKEIEFYRDQLGFSRPVTSVSEFLRENLEIYASKWALSAAALLAQFALIEITEEVVSFIPIIGSFIASAAAYKKTVYILGKILDEMEKDALEINELMLKDVANECQMQMETE